MPETMTCADCGQALAPGQSYVASRIVHLKCPAPATGPRDNGCTCFPGEDEPHLPTCPAASPPEAQPPEELAEYMVRRFEKAGNGTIERDCARTAITSALRRFIRDSRLSGPSEAQPGAPTPEPMGAEFCPNDPPCDACLEADMVRERSAPVSSPSPAPAPLTECKGCDSPGECYFFGECGTPDASPRGDVEELLAEAEGLADLDTSSDIVPRLAATIQSLSEKLANAEQREADLQRDWESSEKARLSLRTERDALGEKRVSERLNADLRRELRNAREGNEAKLKLIADLNRERDAAHAALRGLREKVAAMPKFCPNSPQDYRAIDAGLVLSLIDASLSSLGAEATEGKRR